MSEPRISITCSNCGCSISRTRQSINYSKSGKHYCNKCKELLLYRDCVCGFCKGEFSILYSEYETRLRKSKSGFVFCTQECANKFYGENHREEKHPGWTDGSGSYRVRTLRNNTQTCGNPDCPIRRAGIEIPEFMLAVHHKDRNRENNRPNNLILLCAWCHSIEHERYVPVNAGPIPVVRS